MGFRVEETEDQVLKIFMPTDRSILEIFRTADQARVQVRHFVRSQTSLEDLFAQAVGVD
jgi:hypothetical protein